MDLSKSLIGAILDSEIEITCPNCDKDFSIDLNQIGNTVQCPFCKTNVELKDNF